MASILQQVLITRMGIVSSGISWPEGQSIQEQDGHHWRLLPWGSGPFGEISPGELEVQPYLSCTIRSQGFAPSQRFAPVRALWLCFTPLPPIGFWSSELFSSPSAVIPLGTRCSLVVAPALTAIERLDNHLCPCFLHLAPPFSGEQLRGRSSRAPL